MKAMRKKYIFAALTGAITMLTGCTDEFGQQFTPANTGDYIVFGGRAGFQMDDKESKTRTIYTGDFYTVGTGTDAKKYERVHWVAGDKVSIYCDEASGLKSVDYKVTAENTDVDVNEKGNYHDTGLIPSESENGLQWGNTSTDHTFYAVYPNTGITYNSSEASATVTATLPDIQTPEEITYSNGKWVAKPNMDYAYMIAKTTLNPKESGNSVNLQFMPLVTAVEITLTNLAQETKITNGTEGKVGYNFNLANVIITTTDKFPIYGEFSLDIADMTDSDKDGIADAIPTVTNNSAASTNYAITIPMYNDADGDGTNSPALLKYGESLTFTVFMLHNADLNSLNVTIQGVQGTKTGAIGGSGFKIQKNKKTYLRNLPLTDDILPFNQSNWIKYIEDAVITKTLSIPGAGGAASASGTVTLSDTARQQDLNIYQLWDKGVRCFEIAVDIPSTSTTADISEQPVICNGFDCGISLSSAVEMVRNKLRSHPDEFAMIIIGYQNLNGWAGFNDVTRTPSAFTSQIDNYWKNKVTGGSWGVLSEETTTNGVQTYTETNVTDSRLGTATFSSSMTVKDARGKLFGIIRPTSIHQDYGEVLSTSSSASGESSITQKAVTLPTLNSDLLIINGWGPLKDKWEQRGYSKWSVRKTTSNGYDGLPGRPFDVATIEETRERTRTNVGSWISPEYEYGEWSSWAYSSGNSVNIANYAITVNKLSPDFTYEASNGAKAWVQEWARVSDMSSPFKFDYTAAESNYNKTKQTREYKEVYWANSYGEKWQHVKDALSYAINKTKGDILYINSLCGYFIEQDIQSSMYPFSLTDRNITAALTLIGGEQNTPLTSESNKAGMYGNIGRFATKINQDFYDHIMTIGDENGYQAGSMGIVLMDRVSSDVNSVGSKIPGIIVANNFQTTQVSTASEAYQIPTAEYNGEPVAAPARRGASEEMSITWE